MSSIKKIEYICTYCGRTVAKAVVLGRPLPGKCPRKEGNRPHTWRINREIK